MPAAPMPERLAIQLRELISDIERMDSEPVDEQRMADLQMLPKRARLRIGRRHRPSR